MTAWTSDELDRIGKAEELRIASFRRDGMLRKPAIIWVVRVADALYVRCANGRKGAWFRSVQSQHQGRIWAGGVEKEVTFEEEENADINDRISAAYLAKYNRYPRYVAPMVTPDVRNATLKLLPSVKNT